MKTKVMGLFAAILILTIGLGGLGVYLIPGDCEVIAQRDQALYIAERVTVQRDEALELLERISGQRDEALDLLQTAMALGGQELIDKMVEAAAAEYSQPKNPGGES